MAKAAVPATRDTSEQLPDYLRKGVAVDNKDNFTAADFVIPRVKLLQGISKEVETFEAAKAGIFWHTGLDMPLGDNFRFVVCSRNRKMLLVAPIEDGQGVLARSEDCAKWDKVGKWEVKVKGQKKPQLWEIDTLNVAESSVAKWGSKINGDEDSPPAATLFYDYLVLLPDYPELGPTLISLARSQIKVAKKGLNDKIELHKSAGRPMQSVLFQTKAVDDSSDGQNFKNWAFTGAGFAPEPLFLKAADLKDVLANGYKTTDEAGLGEEGSRPERGARGTKRGSGEPVGDGEY